MKTFNVTTDHLKLLRNMYIGWDDCEFGAPAVDCKRPYGNSSVYSDIHEILTGCEDFGDIEEDCGEEYDVLTSKYNSLHEEMQTVLQILVSNLYIVEGEYILDGYDVTQWKLKE